MDMPVLVVEDDSSILELVRFNLGTEGYKTIAAKTAEEAIKHVNHEGISLVLLDLMLPGMDGLSLCKVLKTDVLSRNIPVIIVSAKGEDHDIVTGLELGAEDYIIKPFSPKILIARVNAVLRRNGNEVRDAQGPISLGVLSMHPGKREVRVKGERLQLTATEFDILFFLAKRPGWVFTRDQLVAALHGTDYPVTDRSIDVVVAGVRKKLAEASNMIETVRGVGYRFLEGQ